MSEDEKERVETKRERKAFDAKIIIIILISVIIVAGGTTGGILAYQHHQQVVAAKAAAEAKAKAILKHEKEVAKYKNDIQVTASNMINVGAIAEKMNSQYSQVWHDAIFNDFYSINNKYYYSGDFNEALLRQKEAFSSDGTLESLTTSIEKVDNSMAALNNPPKEYKASYNALVIMYHDLKQFVNLATSPTGSLITFNRDTTELDNRIASDYDDYKIKLPQDKKSSNPSDNKKTDF